jgi:hypothetical protein
MSARSCLASFAVIVAFVWTGCAGGGDASKTAATDSAAAAPQPVTTDSMTIQGFQAPESVLYDEVADVYLVSNINGNPPEHDNNGFISRVSPDGSVQTLKWIAGGANGVTLNAPKGMAIKGDTLFVSDIDTVRAFHRTTGQPLGARGVPGATFLNDLTVGADGTLYVSDTGVKADFTPNGGAAVYAFSDAKPKAIARGEAVLHGPNGIVATPDGIVAVSFNGKTMLRIPAGGGAPVTIASLPTGGLDGLVRLPDGSFYVTSWEMKGVYHVTPTGEVHTVLQNIAGPADIGYDTKRGRLLVPDLSGGKIEIRKR